MRQVRADWGIRESVGVHGWHNVMRQYLRQDRMQALEALNDLKGGSSGASPWRASAAAAPDPDGQGEWLPYPSGCPCRVEFNLARLGGSVRGLLCHAAGIPLAVSCVARSGLLPCGLL